MNFIKEVNVRHLTYSKSRILFNRGLLGMYGSEVSE